MGYEVTGRISKIGEVETFESGFQKQTFVVVEDDGRYENEYAFDLLGDKIDLINPVIIDDVVKVYFNVKSREYNGKYFTSINAWKIDLEESADRDVVTPDEDDDLLDDDIPM